MKLLVLVLVLVTSCSSRSQRSACSPHPQPISSIHCADRPLELAELRTKEDELIGHVVTVAGPLGETRPWCIDCCPSLGAVLALAQDTPFVRVELHPWSCPRGANGSIECPLPRDGRRIAVRGRLERVVHGQQGDLVLNDTKLCEAP